MRFNVHNPAIFFIILLPGILLFTGCQKGGDNTENRLPKAKFTVTPVRVEPNTTVYFDADSVSDFEDPYNQLEVRWDFDNDLIFDTEFSTTKTITHQYASKGVYFPKLEVRDTKGMTDTLKKLVVVVSDTLNLPPYNLSYLTPPDYQIWMEPTIIFKWTCADPEEDALHFDILIGTDIGSMHVVRSNITTFNLLDGEVQYETTLTDYFALNRDYYWQIAARDDSGNYVLGHIRKFTTRPE